MQRRASWSGIAAEIKAACLLLQRGMVGRHSLGAGGSSPLTSRHRRAPGAGAGGGLVRRRRPHRPCRVAAADAYVRRGGWAAHGDYPLATKVSGKRVGIVGLGRIDSLVARRLDAFGCEVSYHCRSPKPSAPYKFFPTVRDLAADSDVLVLSCALTEETRHMVDRGAMEALGSGGVLVNVGLVDEPELVRCLREGVIAGRVLDVYENEPDVPPELFGMDNVALSDHRAVLTPESIRGVLDIVVGNLHAFFTGRTLISPVTL